MVTDDERDYMYLAYSTDPRMRVNVGIRRRLAPLVDNNRRRIELLNSLLFSFPGTPIIYYGDEIGMGDNIYLGDRNGVRTPMQWNSDRNAGFSRCDPARLYFPVIMDPVYGYQVINVEGQLSDQSSLLHWTRNMIALRKLFQVFGRGTLKFLNPANRKILAYLRDLDRGDGSHETVLCVANLSRFAQPASLDLSEYAGAEPVEMLGYVPFPTITADPYAITLAPYSFLWLELQPAGIKPEEMAVLAGATTEESPQSAAAALDLETQGWSALLAGDGQALFESALLAWLPRQRWFGAKSRRIQSACIVDWVELPATDDQPARDPSAIGPTASPVLVFVEIEYADGPGEKYQLPLAITSGPASEDLAANFPQSVLTTLTSPSGPAVLHDATVLEDFRQTLLKLIHRNATLPMSASESQNQACAETKAPEIANAVSPGSESPADTGNFVAADSAPPAALRAAPVPITAQPGEAAAPPRADAATAHPPGAQQFTPRESPAAGESAQTGSLNAGASTAFGAFAFAQPLASRVGSAEQSNTSILYGNQLILKLFRRLQPGQNPDVEIGRFLTETAHFSNIPPFFGEMTMTEPAGEKTTLAMLQGLVANQGDGWRWFLDQLAGFFAAVADLPQPQKSPAPGFLRNDVPIGEIQDHSLGSLEAAALLGRRTAEMHLALATPTIDPAFAAEPFTSDDLAGEARRIDAEITSTLETLKAKLSTLKDVTADHAGLLLSRRIDLFARANAISDLPAAGQRTRIHGDYHLGQTLRTPGSGATSGDFVLLDFEGEPARSLAERRQKQSPLKDVAGMIRSLSYAAYTGLDNYLAENSAIARTGRAEHLAGWAAAWQNTASAAFLRAYRETIAVHPALLPSPQQAQVLLDAYILEKALYELLYELNNRPTWLRIPLSGILTL
jgi:maltose alpha-D-glucosyltransferase / alpha-amylase